MPKGRLAEDGPIPEDYLGLIEADSADPAVRTALNVRDSDATLILSHGPLAAGSLPYVPRGHPGEEAGPPPRPRPDLHGLGGCNTPPLARHDSTQHP